MNTQIQKPLTAEPSSLPATFDLLPTGDGSFRAVPQKPLVRASITQAARSTGLSRDTVYRLYKAGFIAGDQPSPKKILIDMASLQTHRKESVKEGFWTRERRKPFFDGGFRSGIKNSACHVGFARPALVDFLTNYRAIAARHADELAPWQIGDLLTA